MVGVRFLVFPLLPPPLSDPGTTPPSLPPSNLQTYLPAGPSSLVLSLRLSPFFLLPSLYVPGCQPLPLTYSSIFRALTYSSFLLNVLAPSSPLFPLLLRSLCVQLRNKRRHRISTKVCEGLVIDVRGIEMLVLYTQMGA